MLKPGRNSRNESSGIKEISTCHKSYADYKCDVILLTVSKGQMPHQVNIWYHKECNYSDILKKRVLDSSIVTSGYIFSLNSFAPF